MKLLEFGQIESILPQLDLMPLIEAGFVAYSNKQAVVPPVGELTFEDPPGDVHIKYGYLTGDDYYVIKIASGFYQNPALGLPSGNGIMLLYSQQTGQLLSIMLDEGLLTGVRTAVAGAIAANYCTPTVVKRIGIVGTGTQARLQLRYLRHVTECREVAVFGRTPAVIDHYQQEMSEAGYSVQTATMVAELAATCNLIVTTTPATSPLLHWRDIQPGTHITAVGSDTPQKQELEPTILANADLVVADSISQCLERGEISHAIRQQTIASNDVVELGDIIAGKMQGRTNDSQITVVDLTGVAVQDIQITKAVYEATDLER